MDPKDFLRQRLLLSQPTPDLQLPSPTFDPKTGLDFAAVYPSPDGSLPPDIDAETGLDFAKLYPSPDGSLPPGTDPNEFVGPKQGPTVKPDTFVGPPQKQPWHDWSPEQTSQIDGLLAKLDGAKQYQGSGGRVGDAAAFAKLLQDGGIRPEQALTLARYRMSKLDNPGDVPNGPQRAPEDTKEEVDARNRQLFAAPKEARPGMMRDEKARGYLTNERFYDTLVPEAEMYPTHSEATLAKLSPDATDDERLSDAQLRMLYQLAGKAH